MQSEELERVKCCAKMLRLTGVTAACTQEGTTQRTDDSAVPHRPASRSQAASRGSLGIKLTMLQLEKLPKRIHYSATAEVKESPSTRKRVPDRTERAAG